MLNEIYYYLTLKKCLLLQLILLKYSLYKFWIFIKLPILGCLVGIVHKIQSIVVGSSNVFIGSGEGLGQVIVRVLVVVGQSL